MPSVCSWRQSGPGSRSGSASKAGESASGERRKSNLRVLRPEDDDFAASVERDLAQLPTIKERDRNT